MEKEVLFCSLIIGLLYIFSRGCQRILTFLFDESDPWFWPFAWGGLFLVAVQMFVACLFSGSLWFGQTLFIGLSVIGTVDILWRAYRTRGKSIKTVCSFSVWFPTVILFYGIVTWSWWMIDLPGLPTQHDGVAHTTYFNRMLEQGEVLVSRLSTSLPQIFGAETILPYPSGLHSFAAMATGLLVRHHLTDAALLLKSWMIVFCALAPVTLFFLTRGLFPRLSNKWIAFATLIQLTYFRFPFWAADSGGFSRIGALVIAFFVMSYFTGKSRKSTWQLGLLPLLAFPAYCNHPASVVVLGLLGISVLAATIIENRAIPPQRTLLTISATSAMSLAFIALHFFSSKSNSWIDVGISQANAVWPSMGNLAHRTWNLGSSLINDLPHTSGSRPSLKLILSFLGFGVLLWQFRRFLRETPLLLSLCLVFGCSTLFFGILQFVSWDVTRTLGLIFYHQDGRIAEASYPIQALLVTAGFCLVLHVRQHITSKWAVSAITIGLPVLALAEHGMATRFLTLYLRQTWTHYNSPSRQSSEDLAKFIRNNTELNANLIFTPYTADSLEARTGRKALVVFGDCTKDQPNMTDSCHQRLAFVDSVIFQVFHAPRNPETPCVSAMQRLRHPSYIILPPSTNIFPEISVGRMVCKNMKLVSRANGNTVIRYE